MRSIHFFTMPQTLRTMAALGLIALATQACKKDDGSAPAANINVRQDTKLGNLLTDNQGNTLYLFSKDVDGNSVCLGGCADTWPIFYVSLAFPVEVAGNTSALRSSTISKTGNSSKHGVTPTI